MSPSNTEDQVVQVQNFAGLNTREPRNAIGDKELSDVLNYDLGREGELVKRTGFVTVHNDTLHGGVDFGAVSVQILGYFLTDTYQQFIGTYNDGASYQLVYSADAVTWTAIGAQTGVIHFGVQYIDNFYIIRTGAATGVLKWDGAALTSVAGSPSGTYGRIFKDRLFIINSNGAGILSSRMYFSEPGDLTATGWLATGYWDFGSGDGDRLIACFNVQDIFMVFKTGAIWNLYVQGDQTLWIARPFNSEIGCISRYTLVQFEGTLYFCSVRGVYQTDGNTIKNISEPISPIFDQIVVSSSSINRASAFIWQDKYMLSLEVFPLVPIWNSWAAQTWTSLSGIQWAGAGGVITYLVYHIRQKGWTKWLPAGGMQPHIFVPVILSSALKGVYSGDRTSNGKVYKFGALVYQDDTTNYEVVAETKDLNFGTPTGMKRGKWIGVEQRGAGLHTFTHVVDGNSKPPLSATGTLAQLELKIRGPEYFRTWRIRSSATHENPVTLFGFHMHLVKRRNMVTARG